MKSIIIFFILLVVSFCCIAQKNVDRFLKVDFYSRGVYFDSVSIERMKKENAGKQKKKRVKSIAVNKRQTK